MDLILLDSIINAGIRDYEKDINHDRVYRIHKYWSRKPWSSISFHINKYSNKGDLVCDPFLGSGVMGLESILNGRDFVGYDINPISLFISEMTLKSDYEFTKMDDDLCRVKDFINKEIHPLYVSSQKCPICDNSLTFKSVNDGKAFESYSGRAFCTECGFEDKKNNLQFSQKDIDHIESFKHSNIEDWVPNDRFPEKFYKDRFSYKGVKKVTDLHTKRNLLALSKLREEIEFGNYFYKDLLMIAFSNTILHATKLKGANVRPLGVNNYWIPDDHIEENVGFRFIDRLKIAIRSKEALSKISNNKELGKYSIQKKSALQSKTKLFDYIITDPPYGDAIQYSELSFVWNAWLMESMDNSEEVIVNPVQDKGSKEFHNLLAKSLENIYDSLKKDKYFTLCFQNKNLGTWHEVINTCKELGLQLIDVEVFDTLGNTFNKNWAKYSPKSDIYVTFQKSSLNKLDLESDIYNESDIEEVVSQIIIYCKKNHPELIESNFLYDVIVSYIIWHIFRCKKLANVNISLKNIISKFVD